MPASRLVQPSLPTTVFSLVVTRAAFRYPGAVKGVPGTLQEGGAAFASAHGSVVLLAAQSQLPVTSQATLTDFCQAYSPPLYTFLRRRGYSPTDAQDLTQAFFVHLLEQNTLVRASREKGCLRTFLLGSLQHFLANEYDEVAAAMLATVPGEEAGRYDHHWAASLVQRARERPDAAMVAEGKKGLIEELKPFVVGGAVAPPDQHEVAARLRMPISTLRNFLRRLRQRYCGNVRSEVGRTMTGPSEIDEEMHHLVRVLLS